MKKQILKSALIAVAGVGLLAGSASATMFYVEEYSGSQYVSELSNSFNFGFDMWYKNGPSVGTNSSLKLIQDASGAEAYPWVSAELSIKLYSKDSDPETASFKFSAWNEYKNEYFTFDAGQLSGKYGTDASGVYFTQILSFTDEQLKKFEAWGWGNANIKADYVKDGVLNDFEIKSVKMEVSAVPEPTTMLLFGTGLLGLAAIGRRRKES